MCSLYNVTRNSRHWPLTIFFNLNNISFINALNIYTFSNIKKKKLKLLEELDLILMKPQIQRSVLNSNFPKQI